MNFNSRLLGSIRAVVAAASLATACAVSAAGAAPADGSVVTPVGDVFSVEEGTHRLLRESGGVTRVAVGDPSIADVNVINAREVLVTGKKQGVTSLMVWGRGSGVPKAYRVRVGAVVDPLAASHPDPELAGATIQRGASLEGKLPNLLAYRRAKIAAQPMKDQISDQSSVDAPNQVMTEIKIAEVNRTTLLQFGSQFFKNTGNTTAGISAPGNLSGISSNTNGGSPGFSLESASGFLPLRDAFNLVWGDASRGFLGVLSVLERKGLARVLAEPSLTAMSGQTASFLAGGEFPIPVAQGATQNASITVEYKEFGVRLSLTPTVLSRDRIALKVAPEVSELDFAQAVQLAGVTLPSLRVRRTDTSIELGDGESFVISGLVSNNLTANIDKVPWLGDIPILGAFFKSASSRREEKELIMIVTPHLVSPLARGAPLPPIPGAKYDRYRPGFGGLALEETGKFDTNAYGFTQ